MSPFSHLNLLLHCLSDIQLFISSCHPTGVQTKTEPVSPSSSINSEASLVSADSPNQVSINAPLQALQ